LAIGALFLLWFFLHIRAREHKGRAVLLPLRLFRNKISNLGLGTQTIQWLILQGTFFVVSVYLQEVWKYNAIQTGLILTPGTIGILIASAGADRFARRHPQRWLIIAGFLITAVGMVLLLALVRAHSGIWTWIPGLFLFGARGRGHADLVGQRRSVQLPGERPERHLRAVPQRLEPRVIAGHGPGRLDPGRRQAARGQAVRRRARRARRDHADRPGPRGTYPTGPRGGP
jgi:hypothetical protein